MSLRARTLRARLLRLCRRPLRLVCGVRDDELGCQSGAPRRVNLRWRGRQPRSAGSLMTTRIHAHHTLQNHIHLAWTVNLAARTQARVLAAPSLSSASRGPLIGRAAFTLTTVNRFRKVAHLPAADRIAHREPSSNAAGGAHTRQFAEVGSRGARPGAYRGLPDIELVRSRLRREPLVGAGYTSASLRPRRKQAVMLLSRPRGFISQPVVVVRRQWDKVEGVSRPAATLRLRKALLPVIGSTKAAVSEPFSIRRFEGGRTSPVELHYPSPRARTTATVGQSVLAAPILETKTLGTTSKSTLSPASAGLKLDSAATDRLAEEVMRRVDRRIRIERERRGL